jgi:DNA-binding NtrC family response regulator
VKNVAILLVGPPSAVRDQYELAFRRHTADVRVSDDCPGARRQIHSMDIQAVVLAVPAVDAEVEDLLHEIRGTRSNVPVFFTGSNQSSGGPPQLSQPDVIFMPPAASAESVERLLFPWADGTAVSPPVEESAGRMKTLVLHGHEFPLEYQAAKAEFEREFFVRALEREDGNVSRTARAVHIARRNLQLKVRIYKIDLRRIRKKDESAE